MRRSEATCLGSATINRSFEVDAILEQDYSVNYQKTWNSALETVTREDASPPFFAGVDVGGTSIKIGIVDDQGLRVGYASFPTEDEKGVPYAIERMKNTLDSLVQEANLASGDIVAIGLGTPGTMDLPAGYIVNPPNLPGWRHYPIRDSLAKATGKPVVFANDAGAAAFGEFWIGSGTSHQSIVMLTLGTGVGGGIIIDGQSVDGENSHGSECGHIVVDTSPDARLCSCGLRGHLEAYASATALVKRCEESLKAGVKSQLGDRLQEKNKITALDIASAAEAGDQLAFGLVMETADYLALGIANFMHIIDPSALILGGAMNFGGPANELGNNFLERIRESTRKITLPIISKNVSIEFALLGGDAGYIGAAGLARQSYLRRQ